MAIQTLLCRHCGSDQLIRNGHAPNGKQKFLCHACGRQSREDPRPRGYAEPERDLILRAYRERSSLRGLQRTFGVAPATVVKWLKKSPEVAAPDHYPGQTAA
jgi:transposase-like protein